MNHLLRRYPPGGYAEDLFDFYVLGVTRLDLIQIVAGQLKRLTEGQWPTRLGPSAVVKSKSGLYDEYASWE